jgi:Putative Flp pilus-assembly TadE/G-like
VGDRGPNDRGPGDRGTVLALMPAALLVLLLLAAIAVDTTTEYLARRELAAAADAAANDAVTFGLDEARFRETGEFVLDSARAEEAVRRALAARAGGVVDRAAIDVATDPEEGTVTVTLRSTAHLVFSPIVPGAPHDVDVVARATADVYVGD